MHGKGLREMITRKVTCHERLKSCHRAVLDIKTGNSTLLGEAILEHRREIFIGHDWSSMHTQLFMQRDHEHVNRTKSMTSYVHAVIDYCVTDELAFAHSDVAAQTHSCREKYRPQLGH